VSALLPVSAFADPIEDTGVFDWENPGFDLESLGHVVDDREPPLPDGPYLFGLVSTEGEIPGSPEGVAASANLDLSITCVGVSPWCPVAELPAFRVSLPEGGEVLALRRSQQLNRDGTFTWEGDVVDPSDGAARGHLLLTFAYAHVVMEMELGDANYHLLPGGESGHFIEKIVRTSIGPSGGEGSGGSSGDTADDPEGQPDWDEDVSAVSGEAWDTGDPYENTPLSAPPGTITLAGEERIPIDHLVLFTGEAGSALGGYAGVVAWANNRVWETNKILANSGINQEFPVPPPGAVNPPQTGYVVRLIGVFPIDDTVRDVNGAATDYAGNPVGPGQEVGVESASNPNCVQVDMRERAAAGQLAQWGNPTMSTTELRDAFRADVVSIMMRRKYGCNSIGNSFIPDPIHPTTDWAAYNAVLVGAIASSDWPFSHELGHLMGIYHGDGGAGLNPVGGFNGMFQCGLGPMGLQLACPYHDLMRQGSTPGCRIPVLSSVDWRWHAGTSDDFDDLCIGSWNDIYNNINIQGPDERMQTIAQGPTPNAKAWAREYLLSPVSAFHPQTPLDVMAGYREPPAPDSIYYFDPTGDFLVDVGARVTWVSGANTLDQFSTIPATLGWTRPALLEQGGLEDPLFHIEVRQIHPSRGSSPVFQRDLDASDWNSATDRYEVSVPSGLLDVNEPVFTRLWTQIYVSRWTYVDQTLNNADRVVSCSAERADWAPSTYADVSCVRSAGGPDPGCGIDPTTNKMACIAGPSTEPNYPIIFAVDLRTDADDVPVHPESPYNLTTFGRLRDGRDFCCQYRDVGTPLVDYEVYGTGTTDFVSFRHEATNTELRLPTATVWLNESNDEFVGSQFTAETVYGNNGNDVIHSRGGDDILYGENGLDHIMDGPGFDLVYGGSSSDALISVDDAAGDELYGQTGNDTLCSDHGGDKLIANDAATYTADKVFISSTAGGTACDGGSRGNSTGAHCGNANYWVGTWLCADGLPWAGVAGTSCNYDLVGIPGSCQGEVGP
jgi:hypothetical protein